MPRLKWVAAPVRFPDQETLPEEAYGATVFVRKAFQLKYDLFLGPRGAIQDEQEPLWPGATPGHNGTYQFEIGAELPFVLPELGGPENVFPGRGHSPGFVLVNRMVRAYYGGGVPNGEGLQYLLGHLRAVAQVTDDGGLGDHFPIPMRSFLARKFRGRGASAHAVLERSLAGWVKTFVRELGDLVDAYRMADVESLRMISPVRSSSALVGMWLAVDSEETGGYTGCHQLAEDFGEAAFIPRHGVTPEAEALIDQALRSGHPPYAHKAALASAYTSAHYGDYPRATVDLSTACESFLMHEVWPMVKDRALSRGVTDGEVARLFGDDGSKLTYDRLLNYHLFDVLDVSALAGPGGALEALNWARVVRNQVVHSGRPRTAIVEAQVSRALEAAKALINFVVGQRPSVDEGSRG